MHILSASAAVAAGVLALVSSAVLSGCAAETPQQNPPGEVQKWMDELEIDGEGVLASFRAGASRDWDDDGISAAFAEKETTLTSADVYCFGEDAVTVRIRLQDADGGVTIREEEVPCEESPYAIDLSMDRVSAVGATAISPEGKAGWAVAVHGTAK